MERPKVDAETGFAELLRRLDDAMDWLSHQGIDLPADSRYRLYQAKIRQLAENYSRADWVGDRDSHDRMYSALHETFDLLSVRGAFNDPAAVPGLSNRLREVVRGPEIYWEEDGIAGGNHARNLGFELVLAALLQRGGFAPRLDARADAIFQLGDQRVVAECKRVRDKAVVRDRLEHARRQALADLGELPRGNNSAVLAIDVSRIVVQALLDGGAPVFGDRTGFPIFEFPAEALSAVLQTLSKEVGQSISQEMLGLWNERILAVVARYQLFVESGGIPIHVQKWVFVPNSQATPERIALCERLATSLQQA